LLTTIRFLLTFLFFALLPVQFGPFPLDLFALSVELRLLPLDLFALSVELRLLPLDLFALPCLSTIRATDSITDLSKQATLTTFLTWSFPRCFTFLTLRWWSSCGLLTTTTAEESLDPIK
jgi:hypothetical protein